MYYSRFSIASIFFAIVFCFAACKKDPPAIIPEIPDGGTVKVFPMYGNQTLYLDSTYQTLEGYDVQFTDIKFFGGNWKNGNNVATIASLFDFRETGNQFINKPLNPTLFTAMQGNLGIQSNLNHADPTAFANDDPLNIVNSGAMHWGWNPGYIFIKVEARVDTIPDGIPLFDHNAVFHVGTDNFLQTLDFPVISWTDLGNHQFEAKMKLDMKKFLSNGLQIINLKTEYISHSAAGQVQTSTKAIENFKAALSFMN